MILLIPRMVSIVASIFDYHGELSSHFARTCIISSCTTVNTGIRDVLASYVSFEVKLDFCNLRPKYFQNKCLNMLQTLNIHILFEMLQ